MKYSATAQQIDALQKQVLHKGNSLNRSTRAGEKKMHESIASKTAKNKKLRMRRVRKIHTKEKMFALANKLKVETTDISEEIERRQPFFKGGTNKII